MIALQEACKTGPISFIELWEEAGWKIKVYGIAYRAQRPGARLIEAAKGVTRSYFSSPSTGESYRAGFLGIHDGRGVDFVFFDYWTNENELYHHVYGSPMDQTRATEIGDTLRAEGDLLRAAGPGGGHPRESRWAGSGTISRLPANR